MATEKASAVVVVDGMRRPAGIVTERDIVRRATFAAPPERPLRDRVERVVLRYRVEENRDRQRIQHRIGEPDARLGLLQPKERHVEIGIVRDRHRVADIGPERGQNVADRRFSGDRFVRDAVELGPRGQVAAVVAPGEDEPVAREPEPRPRPAP